MHFGLKGSIYISETVRGQLNTAERNNYYISQLTWVDQNTGYCPVIHVTSFSVILNGISLHQCYIYFEHL